MKPPYIFCIDVGSPKNIGWADSDGHSGTGDSLAGALAGLADRLQRGEKAALGFEAPIWTPVRDNLADITKSRGGIELTPSRPWSAGSGCGALGAALALMPWCLRQIASTAGGIATTIRPDRFQKDRSLLLWEAFVSGQMKSEGAAHHDDARLACDAFVRRWPNLTSDIPDQPAFNHAISSAGLVGLAIDPTEISMSAVVIGAHISGGTN